MNKLIELKSIINNDKLMDDCRDFYANIHSLKEFGYYCNLNVFVYLFGQDEGSRLWTCFVQDTKRDIYKMFFEYLNNDQMLIMAANILENRDLKKVAIFMPQE